MTIQKWKKQLMKRVELTLRPGYKVVGTLYAVEQKPNGIMVNINGFWHLAPK